MTNAEYIRIWVHSSEFESGMQHLEFTNVPMERVHAAIALLNDEPPTWVDMIGTHGVPMAKMMYSAMYGRNANGVSGRDAKDEIMYNDSDSAHAESESVHQLAYKLKMNNIYGSNKDAIKEQLDNPLPYKDTDSMRTKDFTSEELFPPGSHLKDSLYMCNECGALIHWSFLAMHVTWHNKTLP